jgi:hypothetical protein
LPALRLAPTEARRDVRGLLQAQVAGVVAFGVVHVCDVTEVDTQQGPIVAAPRASRHCVLQPSHQQPKIRQSGQSIKQGKTFSLVPNLFALGHVARRHNKTQAFGPRGAFARDRYFEPTFAHRVGNCICAPCEVPVGVASVCVEAL